GGRLRRREEVGEESTGWKPCHGRGLLSDHECVVGEGGEAGVDLASADDPGLGGLAIAAADPEDEGKIVVGGEPLADAVARFGREERKDADGGAEVGDEGVLAGLLVWIGGSTVGAAEEFEPGGAEMGELVVDDGGDGGIEGEGL